MSSAAISGSLRPGVYKIGNGPGNYRMFIQFQSDNILHTAPITITITAN